MEANLSISASCSIKEGDSWELIQSHCKPYIPICIWAYQLLPKQNNALPFFSTLQISFIQVTLIDELWARNVKQIWNMVSSHWDNS